MLTKLFYTNNSNTLQYLWCPYFKIIVIPVIFINNEILYVILNYMIKITFFYLICNFIILIWIKYTYFVIAHTHTRRIILVFNYMIKEVSIITLGSYICLVLIILFTLLTSFQTNLCFTSKYHKTCWGSFELIIKSRVKHYISPCKI